MPIELGSQAPDFNLDGVDGATHSLASVSGDKATLIIFACNHCPYVHAYEPRLFEIIRQYGPQGLGAAMINSNNEATHPADSFENMVERAKEQGHPCPYLRDGSQDVARAYEATRTPEVFLFDGGGRLVYQGGIDDSPYEPEKVTQAGLEDAVKAVLAGKEPAVASMPPQGCTIKWK